MALVFTCSKCGQQLSAPESLAGEACQCGHCGAFQTVPAARPRPARNLGGLLWGVFFFAAVLALTGGATWFLEGPGLAWNPWRKTGRPDADNSARPPVID